MTSPTEMEAAEFITHPSVGIDTLHFSGPFTFVDRGRGIASCECARSAGVYIWTLGDGTRRFLHYVGQAAEFLDRHNDHLYCVLGLGYGLFRADAVTADDPSKLFPGMWRIHYKPDYPDPLTTTVEAWVKNRDSILPYLEAVEVFFAPVPITGVGDRKLREDIEGRIARQIKDRGADRFYPGDCHTGYGEKRGLTLTITSDQPIEGLGPTLDV